MYEKLLYLYMLTLLLKGGTELVTKLKSDSSLAKEPNAVQGLDAISLLLQYSEVLGIADKVFRK